MEYNAHTNYFTVHKDANTWLRLDSTTLPKYILTHNFHLPLSTVSYIQASVYLFVMSRELTYLYSPSYFCSIIVILPIGLLKRVRKNPEIIKYAIMLAGPCEYQKRIKA